MKSLDNHKHNQKIIGFEINRVNLFPENVIFLKVQINFKTIFHKDPKNQRECQWKF